MNSDALQKMQIVEQTLHTHTLQRSSQQSQLMEVENALREVSEAKESYRIIGNVMVKQDPAKLAAELEERKASLQTRINALERQEQKLRDEMQKLQNDVLGEQNG